MALLILSDGHAHLQSEDLLLVAMSAAAASALAIVVLHPQVLYNFQLVNYSSIEVFITTRLHSAYA